MKLYFSPGACSLSPHIALREAGIAFDLVPANMKTHTLADAPISTASTQKAMCHCWSWTTVSA